MPLRLVMKRLHSTCQFLTKLIVLRLSRLVLPIHRFEIAPSMCLLSNLSIISTTPRFNTSWKWQLNSSNMADTLSLACICNVLVSALVLYTASVYTMTSLDVRNNFSWLLLLPIVLVRFHPLLSNQHPTRCVPVASNGTNGHRALPPVDKIGPTPTVSTYEASSVSCNSKLTTFDTDAGMDSMVSVRQHHH